MEPQYASTPFGRRPMTLALVSNQLAARERAADAVVHKWHVFNDIREARDALGIADRALAILSALLTFHPETALTGQGDLVVFPSNEQLISRANGMSPATLRRHLANLVGQGLIVRRDSPNGKRFARKGQGGQIEQAFGFDLAPIVARAPEFRALAEEAVAARKALKRARERVTLCRRDIAKMIQAGVDEAVPADWSALQREYEVIVGTLTRTSSLALLGEIERALEDLRVTVNKVLEDFVKAQKLNANESHCERHKQNSNPDSIPESEQALRKSKKAAGPVSETAAAASGKKDIPLGVVLQACPNIAWVMPGRTIRTWQDLVDAADKARPQLGISPSAWAAAGTALGAGEAAVTLAAIYQRSDQIQSPGGYLRNLVERAKEGKFSAWPMVMALLRARLAEGAWAS